MDKLTRVYCKIFAHPLENEGLKEKNITFTSRFDQLKDIFSQVFYLMFII